MMETAETMEESTAGNHKESSSSVSEEDMILAATLVNDAKVIRHLDFKSDMKSLRAYLWYNHWSLKIILYVSIAGNLALAIFEKPSYVFIPYWGTMIMEVAFLAVFTGRFLHGAYFQETHVFWKDPKNITVLATIVLTIIDMICYVIWTNVAGPDIAAKAVRWSRPLRPLFIINFPEGRQIRQAFRNIRRTVPDILNVLVLFLFCVAMFALMGMKLLKNRGLTKVDKSPYFSDYGDSFWDLYVLVTTSNNPDIMMPAYDLNSWYALFFVIYLIIALYIFMSIVLAVIYNRYRMHLKSEVRALVLLKRSTLAKAFEILKTWKNGRYVVLKETWLDLMKKVAPSQSTARVNLLYHVLDADNEQCIAKNDFLLMSDLLNVDLIEAKVTPILLARLCPRFYMSRANQFVVRCIKHRYFRYFFDLLILANAICIGFSLDMLEWFFLSIFILEILLKLYAFGGRKFFSQFWNIFDFIIILGAVVATIIDSALRHDNDRSRLIELILVLRVLRLVRLIASIDRFKVVIRTIVNIGPSILTYGGVIFVLFYIYAIIGMEIFQNRVTYHGYENLNESQKYCGDSRLNGSEFVQKQYCKNNFNHIGNSFVVLFELMVVNQWHVLTQGFVLVTHKAARLYFISFHMLCVIILLNIFTAFVLEVFILEYTLSGSKLQNSVEKKIKEMGLSIQDESVTNQGVDQSNLVDDMETNEYANENLSTEYVTVSPSQVKANGAPTAQQETGNQVDGAVSPQTEDSVFKFRLKKTSSKRIEVLLQNMFEGEIDPTDELPEEKLPTNVIIEHQTATST